MWWKGALAGMLLMLGSRLLGLLRETALAATLGATPEADLAVTMIMVPDLMVGVFAGGALSLVLLPYWASASVTQRWLSQQWVASRSVVVVGAAAVLLACWPGSLGWLAPGAWGAASGPRGALAAWWLALAACPLAMAAATWATRCQAEGDMVGFFGGNFVFGVTVIVALWATRWRPDTAVLLVGVGVWIACVLRLAWSWRRVKAFRPDVEATTLGASHSSVNQWVALVMAAVLTSAAPLLLAVGARALASEQGGGALAVFVYAWKLIELPWSAGIQVVAAIAFAPVAAAVTAEGVKPEASRRVWTAFAAALAVAVIAAGLIALAADVLATWLYGWGRMGRDSEALAEVSALARVAAWSLPALALHAVGAMLVACAARLRHLAAPMAGVLALTWGAMAFSDPSHAMAVMVMGQWGLAVATIVVAWPVLGRLGSRFARV